MVTVEKTTDLEYLDSVLNSPGMREMVLDDRGSLLTVSFRHRLEQPGFCALKVSVSGAAAGLILFVKIPEPGVYEAHTLLLPNCRGMLAIEAERAALYWAKENFYDLRRVVGLVPVTNRAAYLIARRVGFQLLKEVSGRWVKHGKLVGCRVIGINKEEIQ